MSEPRWPVLIVGAGAGGLAASTLLADQGVHSLVVEKRGRISVYPKARNLTFRSLEILRRLGLESVVDAVAEHISTMVGKVTLSSAEQKEVLDVDSIFPSAEGFSPEAFGKYCPQSRLEPILLADTRRRGSEVRYGVELVSFSQDDTGVDATIKGLDSGAVSRVHADYLLAADGTHSPIRRQLGISTSGFGQLPIFVVFIYFRAQWRQFVPDLGDGDAVQIDTPGANGVFMEAKGDLGVFMTTYLPSRGESVDLFTPERSREMLVKAIGAPIDVNIVDVAPWQPYEQVADQFRCGRVFLVGDSAHTMPPFKGGGANSAIQSAQNLAWKLAAVLNGRAGDELLETYRAERQPVARFSAHQSLTGPAAALLPLGEDSPVLPAEEERPLFYMVAGYKYRSTAVVTDEPAASDPDAVQLVDGEALRGEAGTRVPHAWVQRDGMRMSTLDLLGKGFTLFTGSAGTPWASAAVSVSALLDVSIDVHRIGPDADISEVDGGWTKLTRLSPDAALLVRPDDFVAWRSDALPESPQTELHRVLRHILARP
ncbi:FAD-dependent monooxygenase [Nocardia australiensis]|uniref:FAD-dependent monooxygenase n=1 Tax=Nocardia australiensis TaxID=2887191 RepID=UPI001D1384C5|nr:FAD-dependent monooxygenase [Nocardia australiensis]